MRIMRPCSAGDAVRSEPSGSLTTTVLSWKFEKFLKINNWKNIYFKKQTCSSTPAEMSVNTNFAVSCASISGYLWSVSGFSAIGTITGGHWRYDRARAPTAACVCEIWRFKNFKPLKFFKKYFPKMQPSLVIGRSWARNPSHPCAARHSHLSSRSVGWSGSSAWRGSSENHNWSIQKKKLVISESCIV